MNITNGGGVTDSSGSNPAQGAGAVAVINVNGPGSMWTLADNLSMAVNATSTATMNVTNGGTVSMSGGGLAVGWNGT